MDVSTVKQAPVQPSQAPKRAESAEQSSKQQATQRKEQSEARQTPVDKPSPVVNTQGQVTGRLINTTA